MPITIQGRPSPLQWLAILGGVGLAIGGVLHVAQLALEWATDYQPAATQMSDRMMEKKSRQLQRVIDGMVAHDYKQVADAAEEIEEISESMEWFIADKEYEPDRVAFRESLHDLRTAAETNNSQDAIKSADALVDSCMRCHEHLLESRVSR